MRGTLTRGIRRWQLLGAKMLSVLLFIGAGLIIVALAIVPSSLVATALAFDDARGLADAGQWSTVVVMFSKAVYGLMPYAILALFLSVLTSSSSKGMSIGLAYFFVELMVFQVARGQGDWLGDVSDILLGPSVTAWMIETGINANTPQQTLFPLSDPPSQLHAFLVVMAYMVIAGVAAFWLFQRRDIAGAKGE